MDLANTQFFGLLRARLDQLSQRQRLISENIANASTPGYRPRDVDTSGFERMLASHAQSSSGVTLSRTNAHHMTSGGATSADAKVISRSDSETTIDGNEVVLEEQMARAAETRMAFETGVALYQKGLQLVRLAVKPPSR